MNLRNSYEQLNSDEFTDLLWQENQETERLETRRHSSATMTADIEIYLSSTH